MKSTILFFAIFLLLSPILAEAALTGPYDNSGDGPTVQDTDSGAGVGQNDTKKSSIVTCSGIDCNACDLVATTNNIVNTLITLLTIAATIMFVIAGFQLVTSGGNTAAMQSAKNMFQNVLIGFIIVLSAWLLVDTILKTLTEGGGGLELWTDLRGNCTGVSVQQTGNTNVDLKVPTNQTGGSSGATRGGTSGDGTRGGSLEPVQYLPPR